MWLGALPAYGIASTSFSWLIAKLSTARSAASIAFRRGAAVPPAIQMYASAVRRTLELFIDAAPRRAGCAAGARRPSWNTRTGRSSLRPGCRAAGYWSSTPAGVNMTMRLISASLFCVLPIAPVVALLGLWVVHELKLPYSLRRCHTLWREGKGRAHHASAPTIAFTSMNSARPNLPCSRLLLGLFVAAEGQVGIGCWLPFT